MSCYSHTCSQGCDCPVRRANSFPIVTGASLKAPPLPVEPVPVDRKDQALHLARWTVLTLAAMASAAALAAFLNK